MDLMKYEFLSFPKGYFVHSCASALSSAHSDFARVTAATCWHHSHGSHRKERLGHLPAVSSHIDRDLPDRGGMFLIPRRHHQKGYWLALLTAAIRFTQPHF
jgi:hypothetical protein